jgi:hypothetical protein
MIRKLLTAICCLAAFTACTIDYYEKGEGDYSSMQGDFAMVHANNDKKIDYADLDNGERLYLAEPLAKTWVDKADTFYRSVFYYKKIGSSIEVVSITQINEIDIVSADTLKKRKVEVKTDPLTLESLWLSRNKQYMNASIYLKTGSATDENAIHRLGLVLDSVHLNKDKTTVVYMRLFHDQGGMPEHYSVNTFFSLPLEKLPVDSICLTVNTYDGKQTKCLSIK